MQTLAVLLTVFNRKAETLECLNLLYDQLPLKGIQTRVYLTDDGCTDGTPEEVKACFPKVQIVKGNGNLFWNRGMYKAWQEAAKLDYDFYLWLNDDTFFYQNALYSLLETSFYNDNKAIIIGATQSSDHSHITYGGRLKNGQIPDPVAGMTDVDYFNGNVVLVPKSVYHVLGNLDPYFAHSKGDFDYGMRAKESGIKMVQVGSFVGECDLHEHLDKWCDPSVPFLHRWQCLHRPNGMPPKETFHLEKRHYGILTAAFHYCTIYLRCLFPWVWVKLKCNF